MNEKSMKYFREKNIEEVVKENGCLVVATINKDYDEKGNFMGNYSKEFEIAKKYLEKYNPERLSMEIYREQKRIITKLFGKDFYEKNFCKN